MAACWAQPQGDSQMPSLCPHGDAPSFREDLCRHTASMAWWASPLSSHLYRVPSKGAGLMQGHHQMHKPYPSRSVNLCRQVPKVIDLLSPHLLGTHQAKTNDAHWSRPELYPLLRVCAGTKSYRICPQCHSNQLRAFQHEWNSKIRPGLFVFFFKGGAYK